MKEVPFKIRRLLSDGRAIIDVDGLYRVQFLPSGRIHAELQQRWEAESFCKTFNRCFREGNGFTDRAFAIPYDQVFAANTKEMKRLTKRKAGRKGGAA